MDAREKELEDKQIELGKVQAVLRQQIQELNNFYHTQKLTKENLERLISGGQQINFSIVKGHNDYIEKLLNDIEKQKELIEQTEKLIEEKKQEVTEALKAKEIMGKLKEKDYKAFLKNMEQIESKELDDIALARHNRQN